MATVMKTGTNISRSSSSNIYTSYNLKMLLLESLAHRICHDIIRWVLYKGIDTKIYLKMSMITPEQIPQFPRLRTAISQRVARNFCMVAGQDGWNTCEIAEAKFPSRLFRHRISEARYSLCNVIGVRQQQKISMV